MNKVVQLLSPTPVKQRPIAEPGALHATASQYLGKLARRGRAPNTIKSYEVDLGQFIGYASQHGIDYIQLITSETVEQFLDALIQGHDIKPNTAARKRETLRGFFAYCIQRGLIARNPVDETLSIKITTTRRIAPSEQALLQAIDAIPTNTVLGLRDRAFFRLMFDAALRASAPCALDIYDPTNPPANTVMPHGMVLFTNKGGEVESNPLDETTMEYLRAWLAVRGKWARPSQQALFVSRLGERVTRQAMHERCKAMGKAAGMPYLHMHLFRHRRIGEVIERLGLRDGSDLAHHKNINTTQQVYGHYTEQHRHQRLRKHCALGSHHSEDPYENDNQH